MSGSDIEPISPSVVPVVVLGSGLTALGVVRSLASAAIPAVLVDDTRSMASLSRWARNRVITYPESPDPEPLEALLDQLPFERAVIMACSDNWTAAVAALPERTHQRFVTSMPSRAAIGMMADKAQFAEAVQRLGIAHPWTRVIRSESDLDTVPDDLWPSIFLKPTDSQRFCLTFGVKAFAAGNRADAARRWRQMDELGIGVLAQEYIPGGPDRHYFLDGFIDREGRVKGIFSRRRTRMFPTDYGNSTFMYSVPLDTMSAAAEGLAILLEDASYRGIFNAEFKLDPRDGIARILEVNTRPWWYVEFATLCGVNVCELAYLDALGQPVPDRSSFPIGARHRLMPDDFHAFRQLRRDDRLTTGTWLHEVWGASDAVLRWSDPLPAMQSLRALPSRATRKVGKAVRRRRQVA